MPPDPAEVTSVETAADYLYGLDAGAFVAARDELVRAIRAAGRRELAAEVKALRRPSVVAAELNRVLRSAPADLDRLLAAAGDMRRGHERMVAGEPVDLAALRAVHREAARSLAAGARRHADAIEAVLERASLDGAQHPGLRAAAYATEPEVAVGFDLVGPLPDGPVPPRSRAGTPPRRLRPVPGAGHDADDGVVPEPAPAPARASGAPGAAAEGATIARDRAAAAHDEAVHAEELAGRRVAAATELASRAAQRVDELEDRLAEARRHLVESNHKLERARSAAERAAARLAETSAALDQAEQGMERGSAPDGPRRQG